MLSRYADEISSGQLLERYFPGFAEFYKVRAPKKKDAKLVYGLDAEGNPLVTGVRPVEGETINLGERGFKKFKGQKDQKEQKEQKPKITRKQLLDIESKIHKSELEEEVRANISAFNEFAATHGINYNYRIRYDDKSGDAEIIKIPVRATGAGESKSPSSGSVAPRRQGESIEEYLKRMNR
jgi:hypothetical protein